MSESRNFVSHLCDLRRGALLKHFRIPLLILAAVVFSASVWAQGSDPKPIPQMGTDATVITLTNPNPTLPNVLAQKSTTANPCPFQSSYCVDDNFENATGKTITSITMLFPMQSSNDMTLVFNCPPKTEMLAAVFFDNCSQSAGPMGAEDITFSADGKNGFNGVASAGSIVCIPDFDDFFGGCNKDDQRTADGLFAIDMYGSDVGADTRITATAITTPEPGAGLLVLFSTLAFSLFKLVRRGV
jgi:hypothetical protein